MDLIINLIIGLAVLGSIAWIITNIISFFSGPSNLSKNHKDNIINDESFQKLEELFLDAVNLYSCPITKDTLKVAPAARLCASTIAKTVNETQKQQLISSLQWVSDMAVKTGMEKKIIDKHTEILEHINQKEWSQIDSIKDKTELRELNTEFIDAILNYEGDYLKTKFPKHFN